MAKIVKEPTFIGMDAGRKNTTGNQNVFIGQAAGFENTTGALNTFIGDDAGISNTTGSENTFVGETSGYNNTTGNFNTFIGDDAGFYNTIGTENTFIGENSGLNNIIGDFNTFVGRSSGALNTSGNLNVFIGHDAGLNNTTGTANVYLGTDAGDNDMTGHDNLCLGFNANLSQTNLHHASAIGASAFCNANNKVRIGYTGITVIEGQVDWSFPSDGRFKSNVEEKVKGLDFIMKLRPVTYTFDVKKFNEYIAPGQDHNLEVDNGKAVKHAQNLEDMEAASNIVYSGFIAQEVEEAIKLAGYDDFSGLITPQNEKDNYGLRYGTFVVPLVKAVQEQQEIIENQNQKIQLLEAALNDQKLELDLIKEMIASKGVQDN